MKKRVLLVDGDQSLLRKLGRRLKKAQFEVKAASDGAKALESSLSSKPDIIVTNYHLPIFDGERLRAFLRNNPTTVHIPIIFMVDSGREKDTTLASIGPDPALIKPFRWEEISLKIDQSLNPSISGEDQKKAAGKGVEGNLQEVSLVDLLQIFNLNRRTGVLSLHHEDMEGTVHLEGGEVISTTLGDHRGEKALYRILRWKEGTFSYKPVEFSVSVNVSRPMDALLMEGMRQLDEWDTIQKTMPSGSAVLKMNKGPDELPKDLRPVTQEIILLLEFFSTVDDIIEKSSFTDYETCRSILGLIQKGILSPIEERRRKTRDDRPLITAEQAVSIRKILRVDESEARYLGWGKVLLFSPSAKLIKEFLSDAGNLDEFKLSRDNFSNQEILKASFGNLGALEISDQIRLQLFVLPSDRLSRPLWKPFSEGSIGAIILRESENGGNGSGDLDDVNRFITETMNLPHVNLDMQAEEGDRYSASDVFKDLFKLLIPDEAEHGAAQS